LIKAQRTGNARRKRRSFRVSPEKYMFGNIEKRSTRRSREKDARRPCSTMWQSRSPGSRACQPSHAKKLGKQRYYIVSNSRPSISDPSYHGKERVGLHVDRLTFASLRQERTCRSFNYCFLLHRSNPSPLVLLQEQTQCFTDAGFCSAFPVAHDGVARPIASG
jgi:hypothetical protein